MKKMFSTKNLLLIIIFFISMTFANCNRKTNSVCENNKQNTKKENNLPPLEKCSPGIFPSDGLNIKI